MTPLLQLVDALLGATAYGVNQHYAADSASPHKLALARHVMRKAGVKDMTSSTARTGKFTIWRRLLQK